MYYMIRMFYFFFFLFVSGEKYYFHYHATVSGKIYCMYLLLTVFVVLVRADEDDQKSCYETYWDE